MAVFKCLECGGSVSDKAETCPHCGAPVKPMLEEIERQKPEPEHRSGSARDAADAQAPKSRKTMIIIAVVLLAAAAAFTFVRMNRDKVPPDFSELESGHTINVTCGTEFNLRDYLAENITVTDDKDGVITDYTIVMDEKVYNSETGEVDTMQDGVFAVKIQAEDDADNISTFALKLSLNPIHIEAGNVEKTVYDGEYGVIRLISFRHGVIDGEQKYEILFEAENEDKKPLEMALSSTFTCINDQQVGAYVELPNTILPGKTKVIVCSILDSDIPGDIGEYTSIESAATMTYEGADSIDDHLVRVPIILDTDAAEQI